MVTRAKQRLWITYANTRYRFGQLVQNEPSRFIEEIPEQSMDRSFAGGGSKNQLGGSKWGKSSAFDRMRGKNTDDGELGLPESGFVFCCFNNSYKISPAMFDVWMRLLQQVPNSVLWLLEGNATARQNLYNEAKRRGVAPSRLVFAPKVASSVHLSRHPPRAVRINIGNDAAPARQ